MKPSTNQLNTDSISTALILLDSKYRILKLNPAAKQLFGFSSRQIRNETFFELISGELSETALESFKRQQRSGFIVDVKLKVSTRTIRANLMVTPSQTESGDYLLLELQTNAHLQNIRKDLQIQQQSRVSEHMIRNLAHEIKNPLGGIKGAAQLLERKLPKNFSDKYSQIIIREADRLSALVDRLLMPAKLETAQKVNPHLIIEQALELVLLQTDLSISVVKDYDPSLPDITISQNQIQQALLNLIKNATEAIQLSEKNKNSGKLTLKTRMVHQHTIGQLQFRQSLRIDIEDNGVGIPDELVSDIFFPTISGKQSSGLGLSIAQSLVQRHQGIIELERREQTTCFSVYLPMMLNNKKNL